MCFSCIFMFFYNHPNPSLTCNEGLRTFSQTLFQSLGQGSTAPPVALILVSSTHQKVGMGFHLPEGQRSMASIVTGDVK